MLKKILLSLLFIAGSISLFAFSVTFRVDMADVPDYNTPELNGTFNSWCGNCTAMTDSDGDNIWEVVVQLPAGSHEYKFSYDNWGGAEVLLPGSPCTITTGNFTNRFVQVSGTLILPVVCWNECQACTEPAPVQVVFNLDASAISSANAGISGNFNNYCSYCEPMHDLGSGIYTDTLMLVPGVYEFYYTLNSGNTEEQMSDGFCMVNNNADYHRIVVVSESTSIPQVCWQSCQNCATSGQLELPTEWKIFPNPANEKITVAMPTSSNASAAIFDAVGNLLVLKKWMANEECTIDTSNLAGGIYYVHLQSEHVFMVNKIVIEK